MKKIVLVALMALCGVSFGFGADGNSKHPGPAIKPLTDPYPFKRDVTIKGPDGVLYDCNKVDCKELGLIK